MAAEERGRGRGLGVPGRPGRRSSSPRTHSGRGCWNAGCHGRSRRSGDGRVGRGTRRRRARHGLIAGEHALPASAGQRGRGCAGRPVRQQHERRHSAFTRVSQGAKPDLQHLGLVLDTPLYAWDGSWWMIYYELLFSSPPTCATHINKDHHTFSIDSCWKRNERQSYRKPSQPWPKPPAAGKHTRHRPAQLEQCATSCYAAALHYEGCVVPG